MCGSIDSKSIWLSVCSGTDKVQIRGERTKGRNASPFFSPAASRRSRMAEGTEKLPHKNPEQLCTETRTTYICKPELLKRTPPQSPRHPHGPDRSDTFAAS